MYAIIDSEFFVSSLFFVTCIVVLNFWLINLFVAVITNTFSAIRSETRRSAFGAAAYGWVHLCLPGYVTEGFFDRLIPSVDEQQVDEWTRVEGRQATNHFKTIYDITKWCWVFLAFASLALQATRTVNISDLYQSVLDRGELGFTIAFDVEIVLRFLAALPDWRSFFSSGQNWLDLILAIGSSIIQIPVIHSSAVYPWFTIFQLARFYRVILEVPRMRPLLVRSGVLVHVDQHLKV
jgi:hypothetical protein